MDDILQRYPRHSDQTTWQEIGEEIIILDVDSGAYFGVEGAGARVWLLADGTRTGENIAEQIAGEYEVELAEARTDVSEVVADLLESGLLTCDMSPAEPPPSG